jgi:DNA-binding transcriptional ArsR family regulator
MKNSSVQDYLDLMKPNVSKDEFLGQNRNFIQNSEKSEEFHRELKVYKALANDLSLKIFILIQREEELCNCAIAEILNENLTTTAHHLRKLEQAGLIVGRKKSYFIMYRINSDFVEKYLRSSGFVNSLV